MQAGRTTLPQLSSSDVFDDDTYLKPVLEDDALLFGLDEVLELASQAGERHSSQRNGDEKATDPLLRVAELEEELQRVRSQFLDYRETVKRTLDQRWADTNDVKAAASSSSLPGHEPPNGAGPLSASADAVKERAPQAAYDKGKRDDDSHYFTSYAYNGTSPLCSCGVFVAMIIIWLTTNNSTTRHP